MVSEEIKANYPVFTDFRKKQMEAIKRVMRIHFMVDISNEADKDGFYEVTSPAWPEVRALSRNRDAAIAFGLENMAKAWRAQAAANIAKETEAYHD